MPDSTTTSKKDSSPASSKRADYYPDGHPDLDEIVGQGQIRALDRAIAAMDLRSKQGKPHEAQPSERIKGAADRPPPEEQTYGPA